jgi:SAM-dependent methyltransferase
MTDNVAESYDGEFFGALSEGVLESARVVVPLVLNLVRPASVVDLGCGQGEWLRVFKDHGVPAVLGLDGDYVDRSKLLIDPAEFWAGDLSGPIRLEGRSDLAVCLEVAEHLPAPAGRALVAALADAAPLVLFSAAVPGQGGVHHLNEQWPDYWADLFAEHGLRRLDPIRRHIWQDQRVWWWYRQNLFLYARPEVIAASEALRAEERFAEGPGQEWVHTEILAGCRARCEEAEASHKALAAAHDGLSASYQQLAAAHDSLSASYQELAAAHDSLSASYQELAAARESLSDSYQELAAAYAPLTTLGGLVREVWRRVWGGLRRRLLGGLGGVVRKSSDRHRHREPATSPAEGAEREGRQ